MWSFIYKVPHADFASKMKFLCDQINEIAFELWMEKIYILVLMIFAVDSSLIDPHSSQLAW